MERPRVHFRYTLHARVRWHERPHTSWLVVAQRWSTSPVPPPQTEYGIIHTNAQHRSDMWVWCPASALEPWEGEAKDLKGEWRKLQFLFRRQEVVYWADEPTHAWVVLAQRYMHREISPDVIEYGLVHAEPSQRGEVWHWAHAPTLRIWNPALRTLSYRPQERHL